MDLSHHYFQECRYVIAALLGRKTMGPVARHGRDVGNMGLPEDGRRQHIAVVSNTDILTGRDSAINE
jgi:hypothetical protein